MRDVHRFLAYVPAQIDCFTRGDLGPAVNILGLYLDQLLCRTERV